MIRRLLQTLLSILILFRVAFAMDTIHPDNRQSYEMKDNTTVFTCKNRLKVYLKKISTGIIRIWYNQDNFHRSSPSLAVVAAESNRNQRPNLSVQPQYYEIHNIYPAFVNKKAIFSVYPERVFHNSFDALALCRAPMQYFLFSLSPITLENGEQLFWYGDLHYLFCHQSGTFGLTLNI